MEYIHENILGIDFTINKKEDILEKIGKYLKKVQSSKFKVQKKEIKPLIIFTPNPEIVVYAQKNEEFRQIVNSAQINIPDGAGIVWAMKKIHGREIDKITGVDFMQDLVKWAARNVVVTGLIGGRGGVAVKVAECLRKKHPGLKVEVFDAPEIRIKNYELRIMNHGKTTDGKILDSCFVIHDSGGKEIDSREYFKSLLTEINRKKVAILFVALGFPKQEYFIENFKFQISLAWPPGQANFKLKKPLVLMSVGGAFDYISGKVPRAPEWMRERGLEWLYRLIREPWRLPRQLKGAEFFYRVITIPKV